MWLNFRVKGGGGGGGGGGVMPNIMDKGNFFPQTKWLLGIKFIFSKEDMISSVV
jgi:hypothetical protein